jgi:hypothetical protein
MTTPRKIDWMIHTTTIHARMKDGSIRHYWIELPEGMTAEQAVNGGGVPAWKWHGPFRTSEAAEKNMEVTICGDIPVVDGGVMHPDWETRQ